MSDKEADMTIDMHNHPGTESIKITPKDGEKAVLIKDGDGIRIVFKPTERIISNVELECHICTTAYEDAYYVMLSRDGDSVAMLGTKGIVDIKPQYRIVPKGNLGSFQVRTTED